ncbi:MAG: TetR/AcrR family transcriptional regulator [Actinomycetota bacterium]
MAKLTQKGEPTPAQRIRAQSKEATRRALLEAGLAETIARGGEIPSIDAVVARAGFTRGAFYFYFEDRRQYILAMLDWVITDIFRVLLRGAAEGAADLRDVITRFTTTMARGEWPDVGGDIRTAYIAVLRHLQSHPSIQDRHTELMNGVIAQLSALIRAGQRSGAIRKDVDPHHAATIIVLTGVGEIVWDRIAVPLDSIAIGESLLSLIETSPRRGRGESKPRSKGKPQGGRS